MQKNTEGVGAFIQRWQAVAGSEISNSQTFIIELCELLGVERPYATPERNYMFERPVSFQNADGSSTERRIDCYRRGCFVWESKKFDLGAAHARSGKLAPSFDAKMMLAHAQAQDYARAVTDGRPPFLVVVDVGHVIELYAEFSRSGATYTPFPDARSHRIRIADLARPELLERLRLLWTDPLALDPARVSAKVTRQVAAELAELAKSLEAAGHAPEAAAAFLTRCLFSMFAEDVGLLPATEDGADPGEGSFLSLLRRHRDKPATLAKMMHIFWAAMDSGGFNAAIAQEVLKFNGKLFKGANASDYVLPLTATQIDGLMRAAKANWREVEPAIFGTLLERALNPSERHALGAHYTPRAYVERLVLPTVIEPLRADWANAQAAALLLVQEAELLDDTRKREAKLDEARAEIHRFHHQLCSTRVLDPACGSGNFLYVTLEHLKRLEGEVLGRLDALGDRRGKLELSGETVTVQQLRGIELNGRAAALAELVLWIGWLQWHIRTTGSVANVAEPVVHDYGNIECRDAVLAHEGMDVALDAAGKPITRWDGSSFKTHPVTGEKVPDEGAQVVQWTYRNARQAAWPDVDFIVGNPPFIGAGPLRAALGDGYAQTLRATWPELPESADFVMYWWHHAAALVRAGRVRRFGFITTNSLRQTFNRRVIESHLKADDPLTLAFAVPDHPWVDGAAQGAAVRIAMSVGMANTGEEGRLLSVTQEMATGNGEVAVTLAEQRGVLHADLRVGANISATVSLRANRGVSNTGVKLHGAGFIVSRDDAAGLGLGAVTGLERHIREYRNGRDLTSTSRDVMVIDLAGLAVDEVRQTFPAVYQWLFDRVKPERDLNREEYRRTNWWLFGRKNTELRAGLNGLNRFIVTVETSKHRIFQFLHASVLPDNKLIAIALADALHLGVLSSTLHVAWSAPDATGSRLEDRPVYVKTTCFEKFPFPSDDTGLTPELAERIRALAEQLDAHRKARQAAHESVTLTGMYNVLAALRSGAALSAKDKLMHQEALVSVLQSLHDELDAAVLAAYGWSDLGAVPWGSDEAARQAWTEGLLERLVALNSRRAAEEAQGLVRWLRPAFQNPAAALAGVTAEQAEIASTDEAEAESAGVAAAGAASAKQAWPAELPAQMKAVADALAAAPGVLTEAGLSERFTGRGAWKKRLPQILATLCALGRAQAGDGGWRRV